MHYVFGASMFFTKFLSFIEVSAVFLDRWLLRSKIHQMWWTHALYIEHVMWGELINKLHHLCLSSALTLLIRQHHDPDQ